MSSEFPPITYKDVIYGLTLLGFELRKKKGTAHEQWVKVTDGQLRKVTVDKHEAPFGQFLVASMASQSGLSKKEFYKVCFKR